MKYFNLVVDEEAVRWLQTCSADLTPEAKGRAVRKADTYVTLQFGSFWWIQIRSWHKVTLSKLRSFWITEKEKRLEEEETWLQRTFFFHLCSKHRRTKRVCWVLGRFHVSLGGVFIGGVWQVNSLRASYLHIHDFTSTRLFSCSGDWLPGVK